MDEVKLTFTEFDELKDKLFQLEQDNAELEKKDIAEKFINALRCEAAYENYKKRFEDE